MRGRYGGSAGRRILSFKTHRRDSAGLRQPRDKRTLWNPATSMDDIARAAGYSKAPLYVYFANKEELVGLLALESMEQLRAALADGLAEYQAADPFNSGTVLKKAVENALRQGVTP